MEYKSDHVKCHVSSVCMRTSLHHMEHLPPYGCMGSMQALEDSAGHQFFRNVKVLAMSNHQGDGQGPGLSEGGSTLAK